MSRHDSSARSGSSSARDGFTIAEALIAGTVLAIVSATAILPFTAGLHQTNESAKLERIVALGQAMMEEVLARPFVDPNGASFTPGPEAGESNRTQFDNIDDFHGYVETGSFPRNYQNQVITEESLRNLLRSVSVQYVTMPNQPSSDTNAFVRITVTVLDGNSPVIQLIRIASRED